MVVISACIASRLRPLLARQFVDIRRAKVEGLLNAFVKLVDYSGALFLSLRMALREVLYVWRQRSEDGNSY